MKNWKEATEALLAQQRAAEAAQKAGNQVTAERLIEIGHTRMAELDSSLSIGQKLKDINRDVLMGIGEVEVENAVVTRSMAYRGIWLHLSTGEFIEEQIEPVYQHLYGKHKVEHRGADMRDGGTEYTYHSEEDGPYDAHVGSKLTGFTRHGSDNASIGVYYGIYPDTESMIIGMADSFLILSDANRLASLSIRELEMLGSRAGWEVRFTPKNDKFPPPYHSPYDSSTHYLGDSKLPRWDGSYIEIQLPYRGDNLRFVVALLDSFLLQASAGRLPHVSEWIRNKAEAEAKIRNIQGRIGHVTPVK